MRKIVGNVRMQTGTNAADTGQRFLREIMNFFGVPAGLSLQFAYGGMPSGHACDTERKKDTEEAFANARTSGFIAAGMPDDDSPSWRIANWIPIRVRPRVEKIGVDIDYRTAQKEVDRLRRSASATHEHIAYEAARLCERSSEVRDHTLHIIAGALAEDYVFAPGERFEDIYVRPPRRVFRNATEFSRAMGLTSESTRGFVVGIFDVARRIWELLIKRSSRDPFKPYFAHFDRGSAYKDRGLSIFGGDLQFRSALERIIMYWKIASDFYENRDTPNAFCALGHIVHLVSDLHVPAHVHNDAHATGNLDSLEKWLERRDYRDIRRNPEEANARIWTRGPISEPMPDMTWDRGNVKTKLAEFVNGIIRNTQRFRSVDAPGTCPGQNRTGRLGDDECYAQASVLMPDAIAASAQIIANFLEINNEI